MFSRNKSKYMLSVPIPIKMPSTPHKVSCMRKYSYISGIFLKTEPLKFVTKSGNKLLSLYTKLRGY